MPCQAIFHSSSSFPEQRHLCVALQDAMTVFCGGVGVGGTANEASRNAVPPRHKRFNSPLTLASSHAATQLAIALWYLVPGIRASILFFNTSKKLLFFYQTFRCLSRSEKLHYIFLVGHGHTTCKYTWYGPTAHFFVVHCVAICRTRRPYSRYPSMHIGPTDRSPRVLRLSICCCCQHFLGLLVLYQLPGTATCWYILYQTNCCTT